MVKKGQAAMEFLMTYGWAILAAIIVVGVLWYLIGNPANLVGNQFTITQPFAKNALNIAAAAITIEVRNGGGEGITITDTDITGCGTQTTDYSVADSALQAIAVTCSPALTTASRFKGDVKISYTTTGSSITQVATGSISGKVP